MTVFKETLLGMHVNPFAYLVLLVALVLSVHAAATHQRSKVSSGLDADNSPSGFALLALCLMMIAGLITSPSHAVKYESQWVQQAAAEKYAVTYQEDAAHSQWAHLVTAKPLVRVTKGEQSVMALQSVDPSSGTVTLRHKNGVELEIVHR